jgi:hypothetical protein
MFLKKDVHMKKTAFATLAALSLVALSVGSAHAESKGWYVKGAVGQATTTLDTSNTSHSTTIASESNSKSAMEASVGYKYNKYLGSEIGYATFGTPTYALTNTIGASDLSVKNTSTFVAVRGFYPIDDKLTLTGRVGVARVKTDVNRVGAQNYANSESQTHPTYGIGVIYNIAPNLAATADFNLYPTLTKTSDNATDTKARALLVGLQYSF